MNNENKIVGLGDTLEEVNTNEYKLVEEEVVEEPKVEITEEVKEDIKEEVNEVKYEKSLKGLYNYLTTQDTMGLLMIFIRVLLIAGVIYIFKYPINLIKDMGFSILNLFSITITDVINKIWTFICDFVYYVAAVFVFAYVVSTRYDNLLKK